MQTSAAGGERTLERFQLRPQPADMENDKLADYKDLNEKHGARHTNLAYGYALKRIPEGQ